MSCICRYDRITSPSYMVRGGRRLEYDYTVKDWTVLTPSRVLAISHKPNCSILNHKTRSQYIVVLVEERKNGLRSYLLPSEYCEVCNEYHVTKKDFEVMYQAGKPNVLIKDETGSDYYIQSGDVFRHEELQLDRVERSLIRRKADKKKTTGYISPYSTGDYQEIIQLQYLKGKNRYLEKEIREIEDYRDRPYSYRVELMNDNQEITYYLGVEDGSRFGQNIISISSELGKKLIYYKNTEIVEHGIKYKVRFRRQFDIERGMLFGYTEQSQEDQFFQEGMVDPFLIKVLKQRRQLHQLTDIMFTIQKNQIAIVDSPFKNNIIVQGCAGSGKTVVMLQRLADLRYKHPDLDFEKVIIITPNQNFNDHIKGLVSNLRLGSMKTISVEKYYAELLKKYSPDFAFGNEIFNENNLDQDFVDYMYSEKFLQIFWNAYEERIKKLNLLYKELLICAKYVVDEKILKTYSEEMDNKLPRFLSLIEQINRSINLLIRLNPNKTRKDIYEMRIPECEDKEYIIKNLDRADRYKLSMLYSEVYTIAFSKSDDDMLKKMKMAKVTSKKKIYRYDLYLQLMLARHIFGRNVGDSKLICIDEGQDLCPCEYELIHDVNNRMAIFNIFGDTNQLLKPNRGISQWSQLAHCFGKIVPFVLNENFRNTNQITRYCNDQFYMKVLETGVEGAEVKLIPRASLESEISKNFYAQNRLAVLIPRSAEEKDYIDVKQLPLDLRKKVKNKIGNDKICVAYVDEVKGIEFDTIFVVINGMSKNEKYIAFTRALTQLFIVQG